MSDVPPDPADRAERRDGQPSRRPTLRRRRSRSAAGPPTRGQVPNEPAAPAAPDVPAGSVPKKHRTAPARAEAPGRGDAREDGPRRDRRRQRPDNSGEGPWRELTGSGRSQVTQAAAMRARDADRPTEDDLARAEREVVVQRRHWTPGT